jgi:hypothetical protein
MYSLVKNLLIGKNKNKKQKTTKCLCLPITWGLGIDEDSACIYTPTPIYNRKENLEQAFYNFHFEVYF